MSRDGNRNGIFNSSGMGLGARGNRPVVPRPDRQSFSVGDRDVDLLLDQTRGSDGRRNPVDPSYSVSGPTTVPVTSVPTVHLVLDLRRVESPMINVRIPYLTWVLSLQWTIKTDGSTGRTLLSLPLLLPRERGESSEGPVVVE